MKNIAVLLLITLSLSCNPLINISTQGLTYDGTNVYYNGELCAKFSAVELAYDNRKIVREVTFLIVSPNGCEVDYAPKMCRICGVHDACYMYL